MQKQILAARRMNRERGGMLPDFDPGSTLTQTLRICNRTVRSSSLEKPYLAAHFITQRRRKPAVVW
ncbi:hypothetical protein [Rhizobium sp. SG2393]|uniref:hypothetical protein n=1 Tax=Rhizobium sp. SG2393 TaxID=3276279 RepID=UPI00366DD1A6